MVPGVHTPSEDAAALASAEKVEAARRAMVPSSNVRAGVTPCHMVPSRATPDCHGRPRAWRTAPLGRPSIAQTARCSQACRGPYRAAPDRHGRLRASRTAPLGRLSIAEAARCPRGCPGPRDGMRARSARWPRQRSAAARSLAGWPTCATARYMGPTVPAAPRPRRGWSVPGPRARGPSANLAPFDCVGG